MPPASGFIARHGLWTDAQWQAADEIKARIEQHNLTLIRLAWPDTHGASKAKTVTVPAFLDALSNGYNINVATTTLDSAGTRTFSSFVPGGGMGLKEMSGSPNITIVPDPATFRVLPWAPGVGWVLCDEYFNSGVPYFFSARQLLRRQVSELAARGQRCKVGLEVEWYLLKIAEDRLGDEHIGKPGVRGQPIATAPVEPGYSYHSETNMDLMQPVFSALAGAFEKIRLPLRSIENEWGPGQVECTFAAKDALAAADDLVLFRTATRQICRRMGYFATFMCRPALKGFYSSGWHLHLSLTDAGGHNLFMPAQESADQDGALLSPLGLNFLGGVLHNANAATAFATPTVNGYRRFRPNSLAPDRASWGFDHRGAMIRVLGGAGDPATRLENRVGEPCANPYLYILSQLVTGQDGIDRTLDPGPQDDEPYAADRAPLPKTLIDALDTLDRDALFRQALGDVYVDYFVKLKRTEAGRFMRYLEESGAHPGDEPTPWEHNEYFDFF